MELVERCAGALVGLACGDAVGTTVEFRPRGTFEPLRDMVGGGPFGLAPGQWTDDTSMALCLADSLLARGGFDAADQMARYVNWWRWGYRSATGVCFDIGNTVCAALGRFESTGDPFAGSERPDTAGNGALMRLAPVVLFFHPDRDAVQRHAVSSSRTTHAAPEALDCARLLAHVLSRALDGASKPDLLDARDLALESSAVHDLAQGGYLAKPASAIRGTGYAVASLEAALWCVAHTDTFEAAVLEAANLGDDADTTAAIVGQVAGAHYGLAAIPRHWHARLHLAAEIESIARRLAAASFLRARRADLPRPRSGAMNIQEMPR
ncbi:MAG: ADP-ribosylglycohydrolase family protein [Xanthomonadaceae bacterium]|jgi:ADP-ribosyl-[dinitrogen reductase] hydrolase|nr:ADP-ribosylglycohydrolase family protein [Xanthomonadaceae bacterium]